MDVFGVCVNFCCYSDVVIKGEIKKRKKEFSLCVSIELYLKFLSYC